MVSLLNTSIICRLIIKGYRFLESIKSSSLLSSKSYPIVFPNYTDWFYVEFASFKHYTLLVFYQDFIHKKDVN